MSIKSEPSVLQLRGQRRRSRMKGYKPPPKNIRRPDKPTSAPPPKLEGRMSDNQIYEAVERERERRGCLLERELQDTAIYASLRR